MRKIKLLFDALDYILFRLFLLVMLIFGIIALLGQHWPHH